MGEIARRTMSLTSVAVLLVVCACTTSLSGRASAIRWVDGPGQVAGCQYLGIVEGESSQSGVANVDAGETNARHEALERAAKQGATHVMWRPFSYGMYVRITGEAYSCSADAAGDAVATYDSSENDTLGSLRESCIAGDGASCLTLGKRYIAGQLVEKDVDRGLQFLAKACEKRLVSGCLAAASVFDGGEKSGEKHRAGRYYRAACKLGSDDGCRGAERVAALERNASTGGHDPTSDQLADAAERGGDDAEPRQYVGIGTCFAVSGDGLIVTAEHVVNGATDIGVQFEGEEFFVAKVEKISSAVDVAVLRIDRKTKNYLPVTSDAEPELGDKIFTIGFPQPTQLGFEPKYSEGTVSALTAGGQDHLMQLSVPIHQGNSGGAVVSESGALLGIVVARIDDAAFFNSTGAIAGDISFAVKVGYAAPLLAKQYRASKLRDVSRKKAINLVQLSTCKVLTVREK
jgi:S1-C subfamily serine protease